jgi:translation initiation factor 1 (eIF-1/SUI1)
MDLLDLDAHNTVSYDEPIVVFGERNGKKANTYIVNLPESEMDTTLKDMKKKFGCGGSVKTILYEEEDKTVLHLQGDKVRDAGEFMKTKMKGTRVNVIIKAIN